MSGKAIKAYNLGKKYRIGERIKYNTLRDSIARVTSNAYKGLTSSIKRDPDLENSTNSTGQGTGLTQKQNPHIKSNHSNPNYIWSLRNVSFDVARGEIIGIIGRNGAGKSTLLKIISGITEPTEGRIDIYGRIGSLLEVGTGFHPELTGRENIFLNGAILGMRRREIESKFDEIVDFSGIEQFIDTPVKFYSSGMRVRLGFSVAAHLEPEILLLDEVLAVGDAAFQKKCLGKIDNIAASEGRTVLFTSHDLAAIQSLCQRTILLEDGRITAEGPTAEVVDKYLGSMSLIEEIPLDERSDIDRSSDRSVIATFLRIENAETGKPIRPTSQIIFRIGYRSKNPVRHLIVQLSIRDSKTGQAMTFLDSDNSGGIPEKSPPEGTIICVTEKSYITPGRCVVDIRFMQGMISVFNLENAGSFNVEEENVYGTGNISRKYGTYLLGHKWSFENGQS